MKKIITLVLLLSLGSAVKAMDPVAQQFHAEPEFAVLAGKAGAMAAAPVKDVRSWFADWAQLVFKKPQYRDLTRKAQGIEKLFGNDFATTVGNAALQQRANVSLGALLSAYEQWMGMPPKDLKAAVDQVAAAAQAVGTASQATKAGRSAADKAQLQRLNAIGDELKGAAANA